MIDALRDAITHNAPLYLALGGLVVGLLFGAVVFATNFCAMGSLADIHNFGDKRRFRAWVLAAATALVGAQFLHAGGIVDLGKSMYHAGSGLNWVGHIVGGLMLGFGMVFAGGCPSRNLVRAGSGDLRALLTIVVLGLFAYIAIGGLFGPVRAWLEQATSIPLKSPTQGLGDLLASATGLGAATAALVLTTILAAAALIYCFADPRFRASPVHVFSGLAIGAIIVAGWALTGLAFDEMAAKPAAPISLTYVRPAGDALQWLTLYTATPMPGFGTASVFGALIGALLAALAMGRFRIATYSDSGDTLRSLGGAALMGVGGVMALGCTIGQAVTGLSTLALGSFLTFAAIVAGGFWGLRVLERQIMASV
ncbi:MAG TPA: YeeE/YedE family protein [Hyphomicrobiaceae bacterium]|jgi:uncharacterized membrane protein YedE/YeeE